MRYFFFKVVLFFTLLTLNLLLVFSFEDYIIDDGFRHDVVNYSWQIAIYMAMYYIYRLYTRRMVSINEFVLIQKSNIFALIIIFFIVSVTKIGEDISRSLVLLYFLANLFIPIWSYFIKRQVLLLPFFRNKIYVVCDSKGLLNVENWFAKYNPFGYDIGKVFNVNEVSIEIILQELDDVIKTKEYSAAVIDIEESDAYDINHIIDYVQRNTHRVIIMPKIVKFPMLNGELMSSNYHKGMAFFIKNNLLSPVDKWMKLLFDVIMSLLLITLFSPLIIVLYIIVFISTKGHPIFKHERIGQNAKRFMVYKFRSMDLKAEEKLEELLLRCSTSNEEWQRDFKLKNDPRITSVGKFLRTTSLDELPQLINVLKGEMSLVGPRPIVEDEVEKYSNYFEYFTAVKPGITGLWQVSGRNDIEYDERVQLDVWYTRNWSIELDIQLLLKTVVVVLMRKGSY